MPFCDIAPSIIAFCAFIAIHLGRVVILILFVAKIFIRLLMRDYDMIYHDFEHLINVSNSTIDSGTLF